MSFFQNNVENFALVEGLHKTFIDKYGRVDVDYETAKLQPVDALKPINTTAVSETAVVQMLRNKAIIGRFYDGGAFGIFYNRIISNKSIYDFGTIGGGVSENFYIFNGFPYEVDLYKLEYVNLEGVRITTKDGRTVPIKIPMYRSYDFLIDINSTSNIDGKVILHFTNGYQLVIPIVAQVGVLLNVPPNWRKSLKEQFEYKTNILTAYNKTEQRRSLMGEPRKQIYYTGNPTRDTLLHLRNKLYAHQDQLFHLPLWQQRASLHSYLPSGSIKMQLDEWEHLDIGKGSNIVIWRNEYEYETSSIVEFERGLCTLGAPIKLNFMANTAVYPYVNVRLDDEVGLRLHSSQVGELEIRASFVEGKDVIKIPKDVEPEMKIGIYEVLLKKPNWNAEFSETYKSTVDVLDYGYGLRNYFTRNVPNLVTQKVQFIAKDRKEVRWWKSFIARRKGAYKSFIMPTDNRDATLVDDIGKGSRAISVKYDYLTLAEDQSTRKYIMIKTTWGVFYSQVVGIRQNGAGVAIEFKDPLPRDLRITDVIQINFMRHVRLAGDAVEIEYVTREVARITLNIQQVVERNNG